MGLINSPDGGSITVVVGLVGTFNRHVDVVGLVRAQLGELGADAIQVQTGHHLIEVLGQHVNLFAVLVAFGEQLDLSQHLVGKGVAHHEAGMASGAAQVHQAAFGQEDDSVTAGQGDVVYLGLDVVPLVALE